MYLIVLTVADLAPLSHYRRTSLWPPIRSQLWPYPLRRQHLYNAVAVVVVAKQTNPLVLSGPFRPGDIVGTCCGQARTFCWLRPCCVGSCMFRKVEKCLVTSFSLSINEEQSRQRIQWHSCDDARPLFQDT
ncbi:hypothetical protein NL676_034269 [Syzygium grande]|nr:hypothetical protein NL676_034269 [Syzygium grande]